MVCIAVKPNRRGGWQGRVATKFLVKISQSGHQNIIFDALSEVQKDLEDISEGIGTFFKNLVHTNFVGI